MSGTIGVYDTATLIGVQSPPEHQPDGFWLNFFPDEVQSTTAEIMFDDLGDNDRRLAPFVSPMVQGRVMKDKGYTTKAFVPAYSKPKHVITPQKALHRRPGEALTGSMSPMARFNAALAANMLIERQMLERRFDWMACQAIAYGGVVVQGEDYPEQYVDFGRNAGLTDILTSTARWGESGADPLGDLKALRHLSYTLGGFPVQTLIFGPDAWDLFSADTEVKALLSTQSRGSDSNWQAPFMGSGEPYAYEGWIGNAAAGSGGRINLYTYSNFYEATLGGTQVSYIDSHDVIGVGNPNGKQAFGAIQDADAGLAPLRMFPKMWKNEDPSVWYTMTQSAPLMVPMNPDSTFRLKVR